MLLLLLLSIFPYAPHAFVIDKLLGDGRGVLLEACSYRKYALILNRSLTSTMFFTPSSGIFGWARGMCKGKVEPVSDEIGLSGEPTSAAYQSPGSDGTKTSSSGSYAFNPL